MRKDLTDLTVVVDRSGSMDIGCEEFQCSLNKMLKEQKGGEGECRLTLIDFDDVVSVIHDAIPIQDFGSYTLSPRGNTALLDAVGTSIIKTGNRLAAMKEEDRPGLVLFVILTDGHENKSKEFTRNDVAKMIKRQRETYSWKFVFLGAEIDAESVANSIGIDQSTSASYGKAKTSLAVEVTSASILRARTAVSQGLGVSLAYSAEEKSQLK